MTSPRGHPGPRAEQPATQKEAADLLRAAAAEGRRVRFRGGGTKLGWGRPVPEPDLELCTGSLAGIVEHNAGDFTATLGAGTPLAVAQDAFAAAGQMLALDPPLWPWGGAGAGATIGGIMATGDSGPLRHRYGSMRDLVVGVTVVLSDGTVARAGGKVIKNVAGYDLAKLLAGSFGTLGLIAEVTVRLHPRPARTATVVARSGDPDRLAAAASALAHAPLEADCLDLWWDGEIGAGAVLVRFGSAEPGPRVDEASELLRRSGGLWIEVDDTGDDVRWAAQRAAQRGEVVMKVSALPSAMAAAMAATTDAGGTLVARAGLGLAWIRLPVAPGGGSGAPAGRCSTVTRVEALRQRLAPAPCVVLDAPAEVRAALDPWGTETGPVELMRRVKERFDPAGVCAPGLFVGGI